ncbi:class I adenylate-forming enzyme family protein [Nocardiopsis sp. NPDC006938]|uniref:class I adenylate-forming enzyme family protein n=1 Tax=Nocardiopsis sp. NPDC006938 TaxID=3364337 RepID=UPI0036841AB8
MTTWTSAEGLVLTDLVPAALRADWVARGWCPDRDLYSLFLERVRAHPGRDAVVDERGTLSYADLDGRVRATAALLTAHGVRERDVVGVLLPNGRDATTLDLAAAALGAVVLPVPPGRSDADALGLLTRARGALLVTEGPRAARIARAHRGRARVAAVDAVTAPHTGAPACQGPGEPRDGTVADVRGSAGPRGAGERLPGGPGRNRPDPESPARVLLSSGSEGEPTMVAYSHNAMAGGRGSYVGALIRGQEPPRVLLLVSTASSFGSLGLVALVRHGATLVTSERFDPGGTLETIERHRPTHLVGVPTMLRRMALLDHGADTSSLTAVVASGAPLHGEVYDLCVRRFGRPVVNVYGSTDGVNCHTARDPWRWEPGLAGRPDPAVARISVRDREGRPVAPGELGEVWALGPMTPLCHVAAPALDRERRSGEGWVRTGDVGRLGGDGDLWVVDRLRRTVIRGGVTLYPARVEDALSAHPGVDEAHCVPVPDPDLGERMCACVRPSPGAAPTEEELLAHLRDRHGMDTRLLPEHVLFLPSVPLGPTGKVCTGTLTRMAAEAVRARTTVLTGDPR